MYRVLPSLSIFIQCICSANSEYFIYPDVFNDPERDKFVLGSFPSDFKWGAATASYQIEGGWNASGKGVSIWDTYTHVKGNTHLNQTGDETDESFYRWDDDVKILQEVGVNHYRFSIAWTRVLPNGLRGDDDSGINWEGVKFYNDSINQVIAAGIEPMVTLFHWDLPQTLQDQGGQTSPKLAEWFLPYADLCFELFGDRVKLWITFNEPQSVALCYETGVCAPGILSPGIGGYQVVHHQLLAHHAAWHLYDEKYRASQQGQVGIAIVAQYFDLKNSKERNEKAAEKGQQFNVGWLLSPLLQTGDYPEIMKTTIAEVSAKQGFNQSRLPAFTPEESRLLLGAVDFVGLNYYTTTKAYHIPQVTTNPPSYYTDMSVGEFTPLDWPRAASHWLAVAPYGLRYLLRWVKATYEDGPKVDWFITENGYSTGPEEPACSQTLPADQNKIKYIASHTNQLMRAINEDGVNVSRYTLWSIIDNFEWADGFSKKFGIYCVDFQSPDKTRSPRYSAGVYKQIISQNGFSKKLP